MVRLINPGTVRHAPSRTGKLAAAVYGPVAVLVQEEKRVVASPTGPASGLLLPVAIDVESDPVGRRCEAPSIALHVEHVERVWPVRGLILGCLVHPHGAQRTRSRQKG